MMRRPLEAPAGSALSRRVSVIIARGPGESKRAYGEKAVAPSCKYVVPAARRVPKKTSPVSVSLLSEEAAHWAPAGRPDAPSRWSNPSSRDCTDELLTPDADLPLRVKDKNTCNTGMPRCIDRTNKDSSRRQRSCSEAVTHGKPPCIGCGEPEDDRAKQNRRASFPARRASVRMLVSTPSKSARR